MKKPFRKNVALAIDGGGYRGVMVAKALSILEDHLDKECPDIFSLTAGTSTGSLISGGISAGMNASRMYELYCEIGHKVFKKRLRSTKPFSYLFRYMYSNRILEETLRKNFGEMTFGEFHEKYPDKDIIITVRDLVENRTRFIKPWKSDYHEWKIWYAVLGSCTVPTYFPVVDGRYVDGGVGSFSNPCYIAAYEIEFCLDNWDPKETTLVSIGTGRTQKGFEPYEANKYNQLKWIRPMFDIFLSDANDQQVRIVQRFFNDLDFRRFQVDFEEHIEMDDTSKTDVLTEYGEKLGKMIIEDKQDKKVINPHLGVSLKPLTKN
jgi:hypothetical protein